MSLVSLGLIVAAQGIPARAVEMEATLGGKPYATVVYTRQIVPGKGMERMLLMKVKDAGGDYEVREVRAYATGGVPTSVVRTYTQGERRVTVSVAYSELKAVVTYREGEETDIDEFVLTKEGAATADASQFWFFGSVPAVRSESKFWEFSIDSNSWVETKVRYEGVASLKIGEKTVQAHRISIGADTNFYVDEYGAPYKSVQKTAKGDLVMVRTKPEVAP